MAFDLADALNWYVVFLFSTSFHEAAHAWMASRLGDDTARAGGQVSLNPEPHIRRAPVGMILVPLLSYFTSGSLIGWANAPYNAGWARAFPRRCALMALAGPVSNLLLVFLAVLLARVGVEWGVFQINPGAGYGGLIVAKVGMSGISVFAAKLLGIAFRLNLLLAVFNLLPLPPLDGGNLPLFVLPRAWAQRYWEAIQNPSTAWIGMLIAYRLMDFVLPITQRVAMFLLSEVSSR